MALQELNRVPATACKRDCLARSARAKAVMKPHRLVRGGGHSPLLRRCKFYAGSRSESVQLCSVKTSQRAAGTEQPTVARQEIATRRGASGSGTPADTKNSPSWSCEGSSSTPSACANVSGFRRSIELSPPAARPEHDASAPKSKRLQSRAGAFWETYCARVVLGRPSAPSIK